MVDDGSVDGTAAAVEQLQDPRIQVVRHEANLGLVAALNSGVMRARYPLIARMDADDLSYPNRFRAQVQAFQAEPDLGLVGARWRGDIPSPRPFTPAGTRFVLHFANKMSHSIVMFRARTFNDAGGYAQAEWPAEDYGLWLRMSELSEVRIIPDVVGFVASDALGISRQNSAHQDLKTSELSSTYLSRLLNEPVDPATASAIRRSEFTTAQQVEYAQELILRASDAIRSERVARGARGLSEAVAYMLHQMRYRTTSGTRIVAPLLKLPAKRPLTAALLVRERFRWVRSRGSWPDSR